jgi:trimethylamine--corrinoid protein Co-methyltransferase
MESALIFAKAGLPVGFMSMANAGSTAPASIAGMLASANAEIVSAMVLIQMAFPGAPIFYSLMPGITHPRTGAFQATSWEGELPYAVGVELAHSWGVPALAGVFGTDAVVPGWQTAAEAGSCLLLCSLCGAETGSGLGLTESCTVLYPESIYLDSDIYHRVRMVVAGLEISEDTLALDIIEKVGPRGHFLGQRHTRQYLRQTQFSDIVAQAGVDGKLRDPQEVAREKVNWILENHVPQPLEEYQQIELQRILAAAEKEFH